MEVNTALSDKVEQVYSGLKRMTMITETAKAMQEVVFEKTIAYGSRVCVAQGVPRCPSGFALAPGTAGAG